MSEFFREQSIKKTKKPHRCLGCDQFIPAGGPASYFAMKYDGQFFDAHYHVDCRKAEIALNELHDTWGEEHSPLYMIRDGDDAESDIEWIKQEYPEVANRMGF